LKYTISMPSIGFKKLDDEGKPIALVRGDNSSMKEKKWYLLVLRMMRKDLKLHWMNGWFLRNERN
jgi:hypothetical protein